MTTHYAKRRAEGRCISCPTFNPEPEYARCPTCRERYKERHSAYKQQRRCPDCGKPNLGGKSRCKDCLSRKVILYNERKTAGLCPHCGSDNPIALGKHCLKCRETNRRKDRRKYRKLRAQVIAAYGGACACCGENAPEFLQVDHINNDGAEHRRTGTRPL